MAVPYPQATGLEEIPAILVVVRLSRSCCLRVASVLYVGLQSHERSESRSHLVHRILLVRCRIAFLTEDLIRLGRC